MLARLRAVLAVLKLLSAGRAQEIAHHDPSKCLSSPRIAISSMPITCGIRPARSRKLGLHVLLVEGLDRMPVQPQNPLPHRP